MNGEARARQSRKIVFFYLERKRIFQDLVEVKQYFKDFEDFMRVNREASAKQSVLFCFEIKCFRALLVLHVLKVEQYFIQTRM